jgi:23S rRNA pseudouridine2605 synthase
MKPEPSVRRIGLARALSKLGYCSRSHAAELIHAGKVSLNGKIRRDPETPVRLHKDSIKVEDGPLRPVEKIYLMMNKPRGVLTTASDEKGRETVYSILGKASEPPGWVGPVGRLDKASEGLLLLTNDSEWGARVSAPETHLDKTYHVQIGMATDDTIMEALVRGVKAKDGDVLRAKQVRALRAGQKNCWLEIVLDEGKNRHIRRMMESIGVEVLRLVRVAIGPLQLGNLAKGVVRPLSEAEKQSLDRELKYSALDDSTREAATAGNVRKPRRGERKNATRDHTSY